MTKSQNIFASTAPNMTIIVPDKPSIVINVQHNVSEVRL